MQSELLGLLQKGTNSKARNGFNNSHISVRAIMRGLNGGSVIEIENQSSTITFHLQCCSPRFHSALCRCWRGPCNCRCSFTALIPGSVSHQIHRNLQALVPTFIDDQTVM